MASYWLGFATTGTRFTEGDLLLLYDHAPDGVIENKIFAWIGPIDLSVAEYGQIQRVVAGPQRRANKTILLTVDNAYFTKAFDPAQTVAKADVKTYPKAMVIAAMTSI